MEKRRKAFVLAASLVGLADFKTNAQQNNDITKTQTLREVVASATRSEKNLMDVGRSLSVITNEQIKIPEQIVLLKFFRNKKGGHCRGGTKSRCFAKYFYQGANNNQTNILVDGIKISDSSSTDNAIDLSELSLVNIDRIEIVLGAHSTLYGSSAIGGVINIITTKNQSPGIHTNAELKAGTFGSGTSLLGENIDLKSTKSCISFIR